MPGKTLCVQRKLFKEKVILDTVACYVVLQYFDNSWLKKYFRNKYFRWVKLVPFQCAYSSGGKYKDARGVWIEVFTSFRSFQIIMFSIQMYEK